MKRSRIFLGLTTACLAIAGIVAAKAVKFGTSKFYYYTLAKNVRCVPATPSSTVLFGPTATIAWAYYTISGQNNVIPAFYSITCKRALTYTED